MMINYTATGKFIAAASPQRYIEKRKYCRTKRNKVRGRFRVMDGQSLLLVLHDTLSLYLYMYMKPVEPNDPFFVMLLAYI